MPAGRNRSRILALLCAIYFIVILDAAIVRVAIPAIDRDLDMSEQGLQWVANVYMVTFGAMLLLGGRAADLLGRRRLFVAGLAMFTLASFWCGLASSSGSLIAARAVQGLGAAAMTPAALSILMTTFDEGAERNRALGWWAALGGFGATMAWVVGGPVTDELGWEWVFWLNVPLGVVVAVLALRLLPESRDLGLERSYDPAAALSLTGALVVFLYALVEAPEAGWGSVQTIALFVVSLALFAAFVAIESRVRAPLVPLEFFRNRLIVGANVGFALASASIYGMTFILSLYAQVVLGYSALEFGFAAIALVIGAAAGALWAHRQVTKHGPRWISAAAMGVLIVAFALLVRLPVDGGYLEDLLPALLVFGPAIGCAFNAYTIATLMGVNEQEAGLAAGLNNTFEMVGGAVGTAVMATVAAAVTSDVLADPDPGESAAFALNEGFQFAFVAGAVFAALGVLVSVVLLRPRPQPIYPYAYGLSNVAYSAIRNELVAVQAAAEREGASPAEMARRVRALADPYVERLRGDPIIKAVKVGKFFNHYDDDLRRVEGRQRPKGEVAFDPIGCQTCGTLVGEKLARCFVCGNPPRLGG